MLFIKYVNQIGLRSLTDSHSRWRL